ncbi:hypothetical protein FIBSPDRAFT_231371 [Athelia psychrophila]|uniref:Uncharacterized protein n=1 Tax=Athelia psychrophila TaxID=1759441 RepID=A0A165YLR3_9AGAM|nr:hypothetical protein FIBSPDRAFT_231371 [Fibularhizoctonia sp. CBS 109695]
MGWGREKKRTEQLVTGDHHHHHHPVQVDVLPVERNTSRREWTRAGGRLCMCGGHWRMLLGRAANGLVSIGYETEHEKMGRGGKMSTVSSAHVVKLLNRELC